MNSTDPKSPIHRKPEGENYPKLCKSCGRSYKNYQEFFNQTTNLSKGDYSQGPKGSVLVYRNCECGSTITSKVEDMRDYTPEGVAQREEFKKRLRKRVEQGQDEKLSIIEIKKEMGIP